MHPEVVPDDPQLSPDQTAHYMPVPYAPPLYAPAYPQKQHENPVAYSAPYYMPPAPPVQPVHTEYAPPFYPFAYQHHQYMLGRDPQHGVYPAYPAAALHRPGPAPLDLDRHTHESIVAGKAG